jgi:opacity protein-like surface antigen
MRASHERNIAGGPLEGTATGVFAGVGYHFAEGRTQPFVTGSLGLLHSSSTHTFPFAGRMTTFESDDNNVAWGVGAGVKVFPAARLSLRPQFRILFSEATGVMGLATGSVAVGYHW